MPNYVEARVQPENQVMPCVALDHDINSVVGVARTVIERPEGMRFMGFRVQGDFFSVKPGMLLQTDFLDGDVTVADDTIDEVGHIYETGDGPVRLTSTGTLPAGLAEDTDYWIIDVGADLFAFASSLSNAKRDRRVVITAAAGTGTHSVNEDFAVTPVATSTDGQGSVDFPVGPTSATAYVILAPKKLTVLGNAAGSIMQYWWLP